MLPTTITLTDWDRTLDTMVLKRIQADDEAWVYLWGDIHVLCTPSPYFMTVTISFCCEMSLLKVIDIPGDTWLDQVSEMVKHGHA
jgi:hypothetical protein